MKIQLALILMLSSLSSFSQGNADCSHASIIELPIQAAYSIFDKAPDGYGNIQEISAPKTSPYSFSKEHHTAWYRFSLPENGLMELEIIPVDTTNDYDFMLILDEGSKTCQDIREDNAKVIRSVISRNDPFYFSQTGLLRGARKKHIPQGPGEVYAPPVQAPKGIAFYLVVDNVYGGGNGHWIQFRIKYPNSMLGEVVDKDSQQPMKANIILSYKGSPIDSTQSDGSGAFSFILDDSLKMYQQLTAKAKGYFTLEKKVSRWNTQKLGKGEKVRLEMVPIVAGKSFILEDLNFYGGSAKLVPDALPVLKALLGTMKENPNLIIEIQGHVNGVGTNENEEEMQSLSEQRAMTVYNYLVKNGISAQRMKPNGYSDRRMLYPYAGSEYEMQQNRRVEIHVISNENLD
jgi:outer membrane protein OmpA-like peptidoglycan-associated protein